MFDCLKDVKRTLKLNYWETENTKMAGDDQIKSN